MLAYLHNKFQLYPYSYALYTIEPWLVLELQQLMKAWQRQLMIFSLSIPLMYRLWVMLDGYLTPMLLSVWMQS